MSERDRIAYLKLTQEWINVAREYLFKWKYPAFVIANRIVIELWESNKIGIK